MFIKYHYLSLFVSLVFKNVRYLFHSFSLSFIVFSLIVIHVHNLVWSIKLISIMFRYCCSWIVITFHVYYFSLFVTTWSWLVIKWHYLSFIKINENMKNNMENNMKTTNDEKHENTYKHINKCEAYETTRNTIWQNMKTYETYENHMTNIEKY